ncbi:MAG: type II toxin-antitoxin system RelE/ParE family toxin [Proteobacteria bacterium]|nr:type II toxin-antitoxin system RelE/ParE family toxin [Pseudomonadota bacterium]
MEIKYQVRYLEEVVQKHIPALSPSVRHLIKRAIEERLMVDPVGFGKPLRYSLKGHRRLRVSDYRIVYRLNVNTVIIVAIKHRKDVYEES